MVGLERCGRRDGLGARAGAAAADPGWFAPATPTSTSSPVSQGMSTVTVTEYKIVKSIARTLSLIGGGVEPLGTEEEELKGCRACWSRSAATQ